MVFLLNITSKKLYQNARVAIWDMLPMATPDECFSN